MGAEGKHIRETCKHWYGLGHVGKCSCRLPDDNSECDEWEEATHITPARSVVEDKHRGR